MTINPSQAYTLVIDENRNTILQVIYQCALDHVALQSSLEAHGVSYEEFKGLYDEIDEKTHEHDWCKAEDCRYDEKNHS